MGALGLPGGIGLEAATVDADHRQAVGDGVGALADDPGLALTLLLLPGVGRVEADGGGVDEEIGPGQGHQPCRFRVPLVPADQQPELADGGGDGGEAEIAGGEVELLMIAGVVGDMHLAVLAGDGAVPLQHHRGVVGQPRRPRLEQAQDQDDAEFAGQRREVFRRRPGDGFGQVEVAGLLGLAEVEPGVQLLQHHQLGAASGSLANGGAALGEVGGAIAAARLLDQTDDQ